MEKLIYGVAGEGLGHATRALAVINKLNNYHIEVFTYGHAYDFF